MQFNKNETDEKETKKNNADKRNIRIKLRPKAFVIAFGVLIFLSFSIFAAKVSSYNKIYPNVSVMGINLGGLSKKEAIDIISKKYSEPLLQKSFKLKLENREKNFSPSDIEAFVDNAKTAENAFNLGRSGGFFSKLRAYTGKKLSAEPVCGANSDKIKAIVDEICNGIETPVKEESFSLSGTTLVIENSKGGKIVNREKAEKQIKETVFIPGDETISLKLENTEPKKVDPEEFYKKIISSEKNAYYERENGTIVIREGFPKIDVDIEKIKAAIKSKKDKYEIQVGITPPKVSAADLKALLFKDRMGGWTSNFSASNQGRTANVKLSASRINGTTLLPGEVFSYSKTIGSRTAANGYKVANVYVGNKVEEGIGGGICQTSSTLYSAVLYSNLEIVSRTSHSLPVSYMPPGQDATIAEGSIDFKFKNNTDYPIKIVCSTGSQSVSCSIYGVKPTGQTVEIINTKTADFEPKTVRTTDDSIPKGFKKTKQKGSPGYAYSTERVVKLNGVEQKREKMTKSTYRALDTIEIVNPQDKDTPSGELKTYSPEAQKPKEESVKPASSDAVPTEQNGGENPQTQTETEHQNSETTADAELSVNNI